VPNLGGLDIRRIDGPDGPDLELTGRMIIIDPDAVTVTSPPEV
jgi:hypothetical protein